MSGARKCSFRSWPKLSSGGVIRYRSIASAKADLLPPRRSTESRLCGTRTEAAAKKPLVPALRRNWLDIVRYSARVRRVASAQRHDFYLLNQWPLLHVLALPQQVRARSGIHWCEVRHDPLLRSAQARLPRAVGANFAVSEAVAVAIGEQSGQRCVVLPSGVDLRRYRAAPRRERSGVLYVGRLAAHKNLPLLIDAFELAVAGGLAGELIIAGDGPARIDVEDYARRSTAAPRVQVLGSAK